MATVEEKTNNINNDELLNFQNEEEKKCFETKNYKTELKAVEDEEMTIEGYGSTFGNVDSYNDVMVSGAFKRTINNNKKRMKMLWQHDMYEPIGKFLEMSEDSKGLYFKAKLSKTDTGMKAYTLAKDKVLDEFSIGFNPIKWEYDSNKDIRYLKEVKLWEISLVTFAANEKATLSNVKGFDLLLNEIKSGNILKYANETKIKNVIESLTALITCDSSKDTREDNNSSKIDVVKEIQVVNENKEIDNFCNELIKKLKLAGITAK